MSQIRHSVDPVPVVPRHVAVPRGRANAMGIARAHETVAMNTPRTAIPFLLVLLATACAEGDGSTADVDSAKSGWRSTEIALATAGIQTGWSGSATVTPDEVHGVVMGAVECEDGGSMHVDAEAEVTEEQTQGELSIAFDGCVADGVTIDGTLTYAALVTSTNVDAEMHGDLEWSGAAEGTCVVDIEAHVSTDGTVATSVSGGLCGYAWSEVFAH